MTGTNGDGEIHEAGLVLRRWRAADAEAVFRACQDPDIQRWTNVPGPYLRDHAEGFVTEFTERAWAAGTGAPMGTFDEATGELLGAIGLVRRGPGTTAEVGYWVAPWARGRRVAVNSLRAVCRWAQQTQGITRLAWRAELGNHASRLVAETVGFHVEGIMRGGAERPDGRAMDSWAGALRPGDLREADQPVAPLTRLQALTFGRGQPRLVTRTAGGAALALRRPAPSDLDAVISACRDPESQRWTTVPQPYGRSDAEFFVVRHAPRRWDEGTGAVYAVTDADDAFVGSMELRLGPRLDCADVGFLVAPWARGRGYAPAALRLLVAWGVAELGLNRTEWRAYVGNDASRRVAEKAGFTVEGTTRDGCLHHGEYRDAWTGAILAADLLHNADARAEPAQQRGSR